MNSIFQQFILAFSFIFLISAQIEQAEQTGMMNSKIREYSELLTLDPVTISHNCEQINKEYQKSIEAYDFIQTFTIESMEEALQNIGKLRTLGSNLEQEAIAKFEQFALRGQKQLLQGVNLSSITNSNNISAEEIINIQKELEDIIQQKTTEQTYLTGQIQLGQRSYDQLNADKEDLKAAITILTDTIQDNDQKIQETIDTNSTKGDKLTNLLLLQTNFEEKANKSTNFEDIKQQSQLLMQTEQEINSTRKEIEQANQILIKLQESNTEAKENLIAKQAEMEEIELEMETVHTQLLEIRHTSNELKNLIQQKKDEQAFLLSQIQSKENKKTEMLKNISKLEQTILISENKLEYLNQQIIEKQEQMKSSKVQQSEKNQIQLQLTQLQKDMTELESSTSIMHLELDFQKKLSNDQQSFLQLNQKKMFGNIENDLKHAQYKIQEGKHLIKKLEQEEQMQLENYMKVQKNILLVNSKLASATNKIQKYQLEGELKKLNKQYQTAWASYAEKKEELLKQKNFLITFKNLETSLKANNQKSDEKTLKNQTQSLKVKKQTGEAVAIRINKKAKEGPVKKKSPVQKKTIAVVKQTVPKIAKKSTVQKKTIAVVKQTVPKIAKKSTVQKKTIAVVKQTVPKIAKKSTVQKKKIAVVKQTVPKIAKKSSVQKKTIAVVKQTVPKIAKKGPVQKKKIAAAKQKVVKKSQIQKKNIAIQQKVAKKAKEQVSKKQSPVQKKTIATIKQKVTKKAEKPVSKKKSPTQKKTITTIKQNVAKKAKVVSSTSTSPAVTTITSTPSKKNSKVTVPANTLAKIKEAYPIPNAKGKKSKSSTITITTTEGNKINVQSESERRGKSVNDVEQLILKYEELITLKENNLEQQLTIILKKETIVKQKEVEMKAAKKKIKKAVEKCIQKKKEIKQNAKQEKASTTTKQIEAKLRKELKELSTQLKAELAKQEQIFKKKRELEKEEKKLQEKSAELDKQVEKVEKKIFKKNAKEQSLIQTNNEDSAQQPQTLKSNTEQEKEQKTNQQQQQEQLIDQIIASFVEVSIDIDQNSKQLNPQMSEATSNNFQILVQFSNENKKSLQKSIRHNEGMVHLLESVDKLAGDLQTVLSYIPENQDQVKQTLKEVLNEINKLYETAIVQRNIKLGQNEILEKKQTLIKLQQVCLEAKNILQKE